MAAPIKDALFARVERSLRQLKFFNKLWGTNLSLVILCSDKKQGFKPREIWGIEFQKTLWEVLLFIEVQNEKNKATKNAHLFEYIICENLPIKLINEYTLKEIYEHMYRLNRDRIPEEIPMEIPEGKVNMGVRPISEKGVTIE